MLTLIEDPTAPLPPQGILPSNTLATVYRNHRERRWRIQGTANRMRYLEDRKGGVCVSCWERIFGGAPMAKTQDELNHIIDEMVSLAVRLNVPWDETKPPSLASVARAIVRPWLTQVWRPTVGQAGKAVRASIYGARIQCWRTQGGPTTLIEMDLPQAYPTELAGDLPCGVPLALPKARFLETRHIELWKVSVKAPGDRIGVLPFRERQTGRLIYPAGAWEGVYWDCELKQAIRDGAEVEPLKGWAFPRERPLVEAMEALRQERDDADDPVLSGIIKRLQVICVGLLAQRRAPSSIVTGIPDVGDVPISLEDGVWMRYHKRTEDDKKRDKLPWNREQIASYVWSRVRVRLVDALREVDPRWLVMAHTDGFVVEGWPIDLEGWRAKRRWEVERAWESPWNGALYVDDTRIKAPGVPKKA